MKKTRINTGTWPCGYNRHRIVRSAFCKEWLFSTNPRIRTSPRNMSINMVIWKFQQGDNLACRIILNEIYPYVIRIRMINHQLLTIRMCIWIFFHFHIWLIGFQNDFFIHNWLWWIKSDVCEQIYFCNIGVKACKDYRPHSNIW